MKTSENPQLSTLNSPLSTLNSPLVPPGYKQTEVGVIPEEWEVFSLIDRAKRITDGEHLTPNRSDSGYYLLSARNIHNGRVDLSDVDYVGEEEYRRIRQRCNPETGDVLISCSGTVGRIATMPKGLECVMVRSAALVKPDATKLSGVFVQYFLQSADGQKQIFASLNQGAQANLFLNHIQKLRVPLPPTKAEQEAIAEALSDADALIESMEQLLTKKHHLKQGAMQELLTGKNRLPGFAVKPGYKQTEVGMIPEDWHPTTIGALALKVGSGITPKGGSSKYKDYGRPFVRSQNVGCGILLLSELAYIDDDTHNNFSATELRQNDVLLNITGASIGRCAIADARLAGGNVNQHVCIIRTDADKVSSCFINYFLLSDLGQRQIDSFQAGGNREGLNFGQIRSIKLPLPPNKTEQTAIAAILHDMDAEIAALEAKLAKARQLKQGMMQELLTGKIRLI
ncbi:MAG: restriction endonuclease subunit S [Nitrospirales bacterium]